MNGNNSLEICGDELCRLLTLALNAHVWKEPMQVTGVGFDNRDYTYTLTLGPLEVVGEK
jgi:hypothetical protein